MLVTSLSTTPARTNNAICGAYIFRKYEWPMVKVQGRQVAPMGDGGLGRSRGRTSRTTYAAASAAISVAMEEDMTGRQVVSTRPTVVVTREKGKNDKLVQRLQRMGMDTVEMPLLEAVDGPDADKLPLVLRRQHFDWICITSPEAAAAFLRGWRQAGCPAVKVAAVGSSTARALDSRLEVGFVPSKANAEHLAKELPPLAGSSMRVLYPASKRASSELQAGLEHRGFSVLRLNTYTTVSATSIPQDVLDRARRADVVAVASPSAVEGLVAVMGEDAAGHKAIACIGSSSARAAESAGLGRVFFPNDPGMDGWCAAIQEAAGLPVGMPASLF